MTPAKLDREAGWKVGDRVRLKGHANIGGESLVVERLKARVIGQTTAGRLRVKLLRDPKDGDYECDVFPSQCVRLKKRERRKWGGTWERVNWGSKVVSAFIPFQTPLEVPNVGTGQAMTLVEARKK